MKILSDYASYKGYYHFIGSTKYRKNLFNDVQMRERLKAIIKEVIDKKDDADFVECTVAYNHIHVLIRTDLKPSAVGMTLFGASARLLRKEFPSLKQESQSSLWGGTSCRAIKDKEHLDNCKSYIRRHQPDNTKV